MAGCKGKYFFVGRNIAGTAALFTRSIRRKGLITEGDTWDPNDSLFEFGDEDNLDDL